MTLYDEYRKDNPINPEPSEFRDIVEAEVKRALAWRGNLVGVEKWTEADYEVAKALMTPLFDMIVEYESLHYPIDEPSKEEAEAFRREQEKSLPAEEIKPGRYRMIDTMGTLVDVVQGSRGLWVMAIGADLNLPIERFCHRGIVFQTVEEG